MKRIIYILALVAALLAAGYSFKTYDSLRFRKFITVEPGRQWVLLGEWDTSSSKSIALHSTISILRLNDSFALVRDGNMIFGCCTWPSAEQLRKIDEDRFKSGFNNWKYTILPDRHLRIERADGVALVLPETQPNERFSSRWK